MKKRILIIVILLGLSWLIFTIGYSQGEQVPQLYKNKTAQQWANLPEDEIPFKDCRNNDSAECIRQRYFSDYVTPTDFPTPTPEIQYQTQAAPSPTEIMSKIPGVSNAELLCWYYHIGNCPTQ